MVAGKVWWLLLYNLATAKDDLGDCQIDCPLNCQLVFRQLVEISAISFSSIPFHHVLTVF